ncbi:MAG: TadE family protein [Erythrobacter sp.]
MSSLFNKLRRLGRDDKGAVVIEAAFIIPVLATMALGGFEVSMIVSRHNEMQAAAAEAVAATLARVPDEASERNTLEAIIESSTGLAANKVTLTQRFRCDSDTALKNDSSTCDASAVISEYVEINMRDSYTPVWSDFGIGGPIDYNITRRVQIA